MIGNRRFYSFGDNYGFYLMRPSKFYSSEFKVCPFPCRTILSDIEAIISLICSLKVGWFGYTLFQGEKSTYKLVEAGIGGRLSRHNLQVIQLGPETRTEFSTFSLSSERQVQDLHSRLVLNHPRGISRQIHKCIVTHRSGQSVFDGNVKVNR